MSDPIDWLQLMQLPLTRHQKRKLIAQFNSVNELFDSKEAWQFIRQHCSVHDKPLARAEQYRAEAERLLSQITQLGWQLTSQDLQSFPARLRDIPDPPMTLFYKGDLSAVSEPQLSIVGSRKATPLGLTIAERFAKHLSNWGVGIVSGLALGIDAAAHEGALQGRSPTSAVLANGPGPVYPRRHSVLAQRIVEQGGVLITENPPSRELESWRFPERNRLIAGLSLGTLVVEASTKSGSLVTAKLALNQGSEVFAVPGALSNPQSKGCHQLIREGALLVESPDDILNALYQPLRDIRDAGVDASKVSAPEHPILRLLLSGGMTLDELALTSGKAVNDIQAELAKFELEGHIARQAGRYFYSST